VNTTHTKRISGIKEKAFTQTLNGVSTSLSSLMEHVYEEPGMVGHTCYASTGPAEEGGALIPGQLGLHSEVLSQKNQGSSHLSGNYQIFSWKNFSSDRALA
jgi:hypothetical protein